MSPDPKLNLEAPPISRLLHPAVAEPPIGLYDEKRQVWVHAEGVPAAGLDDHASAKARIEHGILIDTRADRDDEVVGARVVPVFTSEIVTKADRDDDAVGGPISTKADRDDPPAMVATPYTDGLSEDDPVTGVTLY